MKYLIANIPPDDISKYAKEVSSDISNTFQVADSHERIPPHFTLQPPFVADDEGIAQVDSVIRAVTQKYQPAPVDIFGFGTFSNRVLFLVAAESEKVTEITEVLLDRLAELPFISEREYPEVNFHITVARPKSDEEMQEMLSYSEKAYTPHFTFGFKNITLLKKSDENSDWKIDSVYPIV